jgi:hypothetical protein
MLCRYFPWWEYAAGAAAPLAIHALFAAAGCASTTRAEAERNDIPSNPAIGALASLLDSLIDHDRDTPGTDHSFIAYYPTAAAAADGIATIAREASICARSLRDGSSHAIIVTGIACLYLSDPEAAAAFARPAAERTLAVIGPIAEPLLAVMRWRRSLLHV